MAGAKEGGTGSGAAYVFVRPVGGWKNMTQTAELTIPVNIPTDLGTSVAVLGNVIAAGAPANVIGKTAQGTAFGYVKPITGWTNTDKPNASAIASDGAAKDAFGDSIALSPTVAVVGAPHHAVNGQTFQGAAYVYGEQ
jgi:FG-GAP repeat